MAVTTPRETPTDSPIAELSKRVDAGFEKVDERFAMVDADIRELRRDMKAGFDKVDEKFARADEKMQAGFDRLDKKFDWPIRILLGATLTAILTHVF